MDEYFLNYIRIGIILFCFSFGTAGLITSCKTKENTNYGWQKTDFTFLEDSVKVKHGYTAGL